MSGDRFILQATHEKHEKTLALSELRYLLWLSHNMLSTKLDLLDENLARSIQRGRWSSLTLGICSGGSPSTMLFATFRYW